MWDEHHQARRHPHRQTPKSRKPIHITYFVFHAISILLVIGLFVVGHLASVRERSTMGEIELGVTTATVLIYDICGGVLIVTVIVGLLAQFFRKAFLFLIYCVLMSTIGLAQFSGSGTAFGNMSGHELVIQSLKGHMMEYGNSNYENSEQMTRAWDSLQQKYKCCGVNNYTDWQSVSYGLTSLKVPTSCCLEQKGRVNIGNRSEEYKYCGQNILPDNDSAGDLIYVMGCLSKVMNQLDGQLFILGVFGMIVAIFSLITIVFTCFLVITKRV